MNKGEEKLEGNSKKNEEENEEEENTKLENEEEKLSKEKEELEKKISLLEEEKLKILANSENDNKFYKSYAEDNIRREKSRIFLWILNILYELRKIIFFMKKEENSETINNYISTIEMTEKTLEGNLINEGVEKINIELKKDKLNNHKHEKSETIIDNNLDENTILEVERDGYIFSGKILKTSLVKVSKKK